MMAPAGAMTSLTDEGGRQVSSRKCCRGTSRHHASTMGANLAKQNLKKAERMRLFVEKLL
jgi:hypothetical protein